MTVQMAKVVLVRTNAIQTRPSLPNLFQFESFMIRGGEEGKPFSAEGEGVEEPALIDSWL